MKANYIICGSSGGVNSGQRDLGLFIVSKDGELIWQRNYNLSDGNEDWGGYINQTLDNGFVSFGSKGLGGSFILKTDDNGYLSNNKINSATSLQIFMYPNPFYDNLTIINNYHKQISLNLY